MRTSTVSGQRKLSLPRSGLAITYLFYPDLASPPTEFLSREMDPARPRMSMRVHLLENHSPLLNRRATPSTDHPSISCQSCSFVSQRRDQKRFWRASSVSLRT